MSVAEHVPGSGLYLSTSRESILKVLVGVSHPGSRGLPDLSCADNNVNISDLTMPGSGSREDRAPVMWGEGHGAREERADSEETLPLVLFGLEISRPLLA